MTEISESDPENLHSALSVLWCILFFQRMTFLRTYSIHLFREIWNVIELGILRTTGQSE